MSLYIRFFFPSGAVGFINMAAESKSEMIKRATSFRGIRFDASTKGCNSSTKVFRTIGKSPNACNLLK